MAFNSVGGIKNQELKIRKKKEKVKPPRST
jgi:hypothetical protein